MSLCDKYIGQTLEDRYTIVNVIGQGGMSTVYGAYDRVSGRSVAIKILNKQLEQNPEQIKLFVNESTALSLLSHPNIVMVYNTAITSSIKYFVMEYVEGITLKSHIEHRGALPEREILYYASQILSALDYIHSKSIIHCDIKPQNIILLQNGSIKVADFGIARLSSMIDGANEKSDVAVGTVYYVSPEQAQGKVPRRESDLYSLGVMLYELITGSLPFYHENATEVAKMQITKEPVPPSAYRHDMSVGLEQIILRAMEKDVSRRYSSASEMLVDINALRQNSKTVFGNEKSSKYRFIDRRLNRSPNVSMSPVHVFTEKGAHLTGSRSIFKTGSKQRSAKLPSGSIRAERSERLPSGAIHHTSRSGKLPSGSIPASRSDKLPNNIYSNTIIMGEEEASPQKKPNELLPVLLGIIAALILVITVSLMIWSSIAPSYRTADFDVPITTQEIQETEKEWNTEHTEKF